MAITLPQIKVSVNLGNIVSGAIEVVQAERRKETARVEAEFQRAIANGLSYENVIKIREKQLEEEKKSSFSDPDYIEKLTVSIADTKKLDRYQKYRTKYRNALVDLAAGKINEENFNLNLKKTLEDVADPSLRLEIQGYIVQSETDVKQYKDNILRNQVNVALQDKTEKVLTDIISRVNLARTNALVGDNQDDVTAHDEELVALNAQLSTTRIENAILNVDVKSSTTGFNPLDKLNYINAEMQKADPNTSIRIGGRPYSSAQQFWMLERDNFLAGSSKVFGNFFGDLKILTENTINADSKVFKENTTMVLDNVKDVFDQLRTKPELTPFVDRINRTQATVMSNAVNTIANKIVAISSQNFDFANGDIQLQNLNRYGVDTEPYRILLRDTNIAVIKGEGAGTTDIQTELKIPEIPKVDEKPNSKIVPSLIPLTSVPVPAKPPQEFQTISGASGAEMMTSVPAKTSTELKPAYIGPSIVDYLKSSDLDSSVANRAKLAVQYNIVKSEDEYLKAAQVGKNAMMNTKLLDVLRKQT